MDQAIAAAIDDAIANAAAPPKKVGRPPKGKKKPVAQPHPIAGVVHRPEIEDAVFELHYTQPIVFKKIFAVLKKYHVSEVELVITNSGIAIETASNDGTVTIHVHVNAQYMDRFFTTQPYRIWLSLNSLVSKFDEVSATHNMVKFMLCAATKAEVLHLVFIDPAVGPAYRQVESFKPETVPTIKPCSDTEYPLKFILPHVHMKKKLTGMSKINSGSILIQKIGLGHVQIGIEKNGKDDGATIYEKLTPVTTMTAEDVLHVKMPAAALKGFFSQSIGPEVRIAVDQARPVAFCNYATNRTGDGVVVSMKIFVPIIA